MTNVCQAEKEKCSSLDKNGRAEQLCKQNQMNNSCQAEKEMVRAEEGRVEQMCSQDMGQRKDKAQADEVPGKVDKHENVECGKVRREDVPEGRKLPEGRKMPEGWKYSWKRLGRH